MKKLKLSKEVVDLESNYSKLSYTKHYESVCKKDPVFAEILEYFQEKMIPDKKIMLDSNKGQATYISLKHAIDILNKGMLNLYYLMQVQAEINEAEQDSK